jgi:hypothetical protein
VVTREIKAKENLLMNTPCQMKVLYNNFELSNFNNTDPPVAYRERFVGRISSSTSCVLLCPALSSSVLNLLHLLLCPSTLSSVLPLHLFPL